MKVCIDDLNLFINNKKKFKGHEVYFVYDNSRIDNKKLAELVAASENYNINCVCKNYFMINKKVVDINFSKFDISCIRKIDSLEEGLSLPPKKDYKFAIIIPNCNNDHGEYNGKSYLRNCIESVLNQTYKNFEVVFVDDMSSDNSVNTVQSYYDGRVHIVLNRRKRYNGGTRNVGIEYAIDNLDFDYFCFLDSDDWWIDEHVLEKINKNLYDHDMMLIGLRLLHEDGHTQDKIHYWDSYEDFFISDNKVWCTTWARIIKKDKIVFFCEDTLMEDRVWSYRQADNVDFSKVINIKEPLYVWNRLNTSNSVSLKGGIVWEAGAWCHIGHQLMLLKDLKHKEMIPVIRARIDECIAKCNRGVYKQY